MIKLNELRIGNYIQDFQSKRIGTVTSIGTQVAVKLEFSTIKQKVDGYEGIPITEEWLTNFGLQHVVIEKYNIDYYVNQIDDKPNFRFHVRDNYCHCSFGDNNHGFLFTAYKHVHEIQNLYQIVYGEELIIKKQN